MISQARYKQLCDLINHTRTLWNAGKEDVTLSDKEYDQYMTQIYEYENIHEPADDSPTKTITSTDNRMIRHPVTMLNYNKTHDLKAVSAFFRERHCLDMCIEPVIDGADVQLIYNQGKLISVITFGDGKQGMECVHTAKYIDDIPKKLNTIDIKNEVIIVSGVVYLTAQNHEKYCKEYGIQLNSRNLAASLIKRKYEINRAQYLSFKAYSLDNALSLTDDDYDYIKHEHILTQTASRRFLESRGIPLVESWKSCKWSDIYDYLENQEKTRNDNDCPIIGQVLKLDDLTYYLNLIKDNLIAEYGMIYKYSPEEADTELLDMEWQVGSSGKITPVAIVHSVDVGGASISRVNLHDISRITALDLHLHDIITVCKTKDVMPVAVKNSRRTEDSIPIELPTHCPVCGSELVDNCCKSLECDARLLARLSVWCSHTVGHFRGVNKNLIEYLYYKKLIKYPTDFYLKKDEIKKELIRSHINDNQINALMASIDRTRETLNFEELVQGLCIDNVAGSSTRRLNRYFEKDVHVIGRAGKLHAFLHLDLGTMQLLLGETKGAKCYEQLHSPTPGNFYTNLIKSMCQIFYDH